MGETYQLEGRSVPAIYNPHANYALVVWNRFRDIDLPPQTQVFSHDRISPLLMQRLLERQPIRQTVYIPVPTRYGKQSLYVPVVGDLLAVRAIEERIQLSFSPVPSAVEEREFFAYQPTEDEYHRYILERVPGTVNITPTHRGLKVTFTPHDIEEQHPWGGMDQLPELVKREELPTAPLHPYLEETAHIPLEEQWGYASTRRGFMPDDYLPQRTEYSPERPITPNSTIIHSPHEALHRQTIFASGPTPMLSLLAREHAQISQQRREAGKPLPSPLTRRQVAIADGKRYPITLHLSYQEASDTHPGRLLYAVEEPNSS